MTDVVISEFMDEAIARQELESHGLTYDPGLVDDRARLLGTLADTRAIIVRNRTQVDQELLDSAPKLECVGRLGVGLDNIDLDACEQRGVTVYPATGANNLAVAEYTVMAAMMLVRGVWQAGPAVVAGDWPRNAYFGRELSGRRFGLIGFGAIAQEVASRAAALGMSVAASDPFLPADHPAWQNVDKLSVEDIASGSDVVSVHVPLTDETRHLVDATFISRMPKGSVLINTARGGVVDEQSLAAALREGHLGGAALDVFENEPVDAAAGELFNGIDNLLLTPHIAGITDESNERVSLLTARNVANHLS